MVSGSEEEHLRGTNLEINLGCWYRYPIGEHRVKEWEGEDGARVAKLNLKLPNAIGNR